MPANKENNNTKKTSHETPASAGNMTATSHSTAASTVNGHTLGLAKMTLKAREFGKEITNASSTTGNGVFSSNMHPQTAKHSDHHHPHPSSIAGVSVAKKTTEPRAGSSGIPEHMLLHSAHAANGKMMMVKF